MTNSEPGADRHSRILVIIVAGAAFIIGIVVAWVVSGIAHTSGLSILSGAPVQTVPTGQPRDQTAIEIALLRGQLEVMRQYDQRLLSTVYWALGTSAVVVIGFTALLMGFNWFSNVRLIDRDKADLRQELRNSIQEQFASRQADLMKSATGAATAAIDKHRAETTSQLRQLLQEVRTLQYEAENRDAQMWERQGIVENAITGYARVAAIATALNSDWVIDEALNNIRRLLPGVQAPDPHTIRTVTDMLGKLPQRYAGVAESVRKLIR